MSDLHSANEGKSQTFVLGPDVFVTSGDDTLNHFGDQDNKNLIIIPRNYIPLLREIRDKGRYGSLGAADAIEYLDGLTQRIASEGRFEFSEEHNASVSPVFPLSGNLSVQMVDFPSAKSLDDIVAQTILFAEKTHAAVPELVTQDEDVRTKQMVKNKKVKVPEFLSAGTRNFSRAFLTMDEDISNEVLPILYSTESRSMPISDLRQIVFGTTRVHKTRDFIPRQFFAFEAGDKLIYARTIGDVKKTPEGFILGIENPQIQLLNDSELQFGFNALGVNPKDINQYLAMRDILMNPDVTLAFIVGGQGSGKSLITYATSVAQMLHGNDKDKEDFKKGKIKSSEYKGSKKQELVIIKPTDSMGGGRRDPGILPGGMWAKIYHTYASFIDTHNKIPAMKSMPFEEMLRDPNFDTEYGPARRWTTIDGKQLPENPIMRAIHSSEVRGRTFPDCIYWIDEPQNFTPYELKTIIERAGRNTKIVVSGDNVQIDNQYCKKPYGIDGLTAALSHYIMEPYAGFMILEGNYRHQASLASLDWKVAN